ncbi:hypothetical protein A2U01_0076293, partial [Trifolium medium]|nr:hypothetical protein [Trifolium medium]
GKPDKDEDELSKAGKPDKDEGNLSRVPDKDEANIVAGVSRTKMKGHCRRRAPDKEGG